MIIQVYRFRNRKVDNMKSLKQSQKRTAADNKALRDSVSAIIDNVCTDGDKALQEYNKTFDGCERENLRVSPEEIQAAYEQLTEQEIDDLRTAISSIFHSTDTDRSCKSSRCKAYNSLLPCNERYDADSPEDSGWC